MAKPHPTTLEPQASRIWERLEEFVREHVQRFIQALLEEEVTEWMACAEQQSLLRRLPPDLSQAVSLL